MSLLIWWGTFAHLLEERLQIISKSLKLLHSSEKLPSAALLIPFVCGCLESTSDTQGLKYGRDGGGGRKLGRGENWLGLGGNRGLNSVVEIEESIWGTPAIYGDGCLGKELLQILFAVADSMKEIWDHPSYAGRRNHVLYSPPNRLWPCSFWWGGEGQEAWQKEASSHNHHHL